MKRKKTQWSYSYLILLILITFIPDLTAQDKYYKSKYELGFGLSLLGTGDIPHISIMNELDHAVTKRLELSLGLGFGRGMSTNIKFPLAASTFQTNANLFFAPLLIRDKYKLKLGTGISLYNLNTVFAYGGYWDPDGNWIITDYYSIYYTTYGFNVLIENELLIYKNISAAFLLFFQRYQNRDTNAGGMLKIGYNF